MFRLLLAAVVFTASPSFASTWPDEEWAYGAERIATDDEIADFKTARKCGKTTEDGEAVYLTNPPKFIVFRVAKDGLVYRLFNADAERAAIDLCDPKLG